jgi:hypothetical protein
MPACCRCPLRALPPRRVATNAHVRRLGGPANLTATEGEGVVVRHATTNWVKQCDAFAMCRPLESTAVRLATNQQGTSLDMP